jgi:hypothetical protein
VLVELLHTGELLLLLCVIVEEPAEPVSAPVESSAASGELCHRGNVLASAVVEGRRGCGSLPPNPCSASIACSCSPRIEAASKRERENGGLPEYPSEDGSAVVVCRRSRRTAMAAASIFEVVGGLYDPAARSTAGLCDPGHEARRRRAGHCVRREGRI